MYKWQDALAIIMAVVTILQYLYLPVPLRIKVALGGIFLAGSALLFSFIPTALQPWTALIFLLISILSLVSDRLSTIRKRIYIYIARNLDTEDLKTLLTERLSQYNDSK